MKRSKYPPSLTFGQIVEETKMKLDRSNEITMEGEHLTVNLLKEGLDAAMKDERLDTDPNKTPIKFFLGEPSMRRQLKFNVVAGAHFPNKPDEIIFILEPAVEDMVSALEKMMGLTERPESEDVDGELGMKPPTPGCDCPACQEKRRFIDLCNTAEAQEAKDGSGLN